MESSFAKLEDINDNQTTNFRVDYLYIYVFRTT